MSPIVRSLRSKILRYTVIASYDLFSLFLALFCASLLDRSEGVSFFASLFTEDGWFPAYLVILWLGIALTLRLFAIALSSFGVLDALRFGLGCSVLLVLSVAYTAFVPRAVADWRFAFLFVGCFAVFAGVGRVSKRFLRLARQALLIHSTHGERALIVGAGEASAMLLREIRNSAHLPLHVVLMVDDKPSLYNTYVSGVRVAGSTADIPALVKKYAISKIIIAMPSAPKRELKRIHDICATTPCHVQILPGIYQLVNGQVSVTDLREVDVLDLLGRDETRVDLDEVMGYIEGRRAPIITDGIQDVNAYINPVPAGLVLTGIVVSVSVTAVMLSLSIRLYKRYHTLDLDDVYILSRHQTEDR
jgi:FlaA1/EpsC-like NDP-sugar epimerase